MSDYYPYPSNPYNLYSSSPYNPHNRDSYNPYYNPNYLQRTSIQPNSVKNEAAKRNGTAVDIEDLAGGLNEFPSGGFMTGKDLILQIIGGILITIIVTFILLPHIVPSKAFQYYGINDVYQAIYLGLIISAFELVLVFLGILFFTKSK